MAGSASAIVWQYGASSWQDFGAEVAVELERQHQLGAKTARYTIGGTEYEVDFAKMRQHCAENPRRTRRVRRVDSGDPLSDAFFLAAFQESMRQAGVALPGNAADLFDFSRSQDFRGMQDSGKVATRGGQSYKIPLGWKRFAVRVAGKYDGGDNTWMCMDGKPGEWAVAYHGTKHCFLGQIFGSGGLKAGAGQAYAGSCGLGIYCSPDLATAEGYTARVTVAAGGQTQALQVILQCRVRPEVIRKGSETVWVINNPQDIRPYGVLLK